MQFEHKQSEIENTKTETNGITHSRHDIVRIG